MNSSVRKQTFWRNGRKSHSFAVSIGALRKCIVLTALFLIIIYIKTSRRLILRDHLSKSNHPEIPIAECDIECCRKRSLLSSRPPTGDYPAFLDLYPGELPGYTGWARPEHTLVNLFQLVKSDGNNPQVGKDWRIHLKCTSEKCATSSTNRGALFYARAYGPAVIPGYVTSPVRDEGGTDLYTVMFHFLDEGVYLVEVVLTFSESYAFEDYPLISQIEPSYEGYMVQGFPMQVTVTSGATAGANPPNSPQAWCTAEQLELGDNIHQQISFARWRVFDKNSHSFPKSRTPNSKVVSLEGYQVRNCLYNSP